MFRASTADESCQVIFRMHVRDMCYSVFVSKHHSMRAYCRLGTWRLLYTGSRHYMDVNGNFHSRTQSHRRLSERIGRYIFFGDEKKSLLLPRIKNSWAVHRQAFYRGVLQPKRSTKICILILSFNSIKLSWNMPQNYSIQKNVVMKNNCVIKVTKFVIIVVYILQLPGLKILES